MNGSGDIYNTGTTSSYVGIGFDTPTNQLHVKASVTDDPIRVQGLNSQENYIVTVDTDGIFYQSENTSDRIDGGEF